MEHQQKKSSRNMQPTWPVSRASVHLSPVKPYFQTIVDQGHGDKTMIKNSEVNRTLDPERYAKPIHSVMTRPVAHFDEDLDEIVMSSFPVMPSTKKLIQAHILKHQLAIGKQDQNGEQNNQNYQKQFDERQPKKEQQLMSSQTLSQNCVASTTIIGGNVPKLTPKQQTNVNTVDTIKEKNSEDKPTILSKHKRKVRGSPSKRQTEHGVNSAHPKRRGELVGASLASASHQKRTSSYIGCYTNSPEKDLNGNRAPGSAIKDQFGPPPTAQMASRPLEDNPPKDNYTATAEGKGTQGGMRRKNSEARSMTIYQGGAAGFRVGGAGAARRLDHPAQQSQPGQPHNTVTGGYNPQIQSQAQQQLIDNGLSKQRNSNPAPNGHNGGVVRKRSRLVAGGAPAPSQTSNSNLAADKDNLVRVVSLNAQSQKKRQQVQQFSSTAASAELAVSQSFSDSQQKDKKFTSVNQHSNSDRMQALLSNYNDKVQQTATYLKDNESKLQLENSADRKMTLDGAQLAAQQSFRYEYEKLNQAHIQMPSLFQNGTAASASDARLLQNVQPTAEASSIGYPPPASTASQPHSNASGNGIQSPGTAAAAQQSNFFVDAPQQPNQLHSNFSALYKQDNQIKSYFAKYQKQTKNGQMTSTIGFSASKHNQKLEKSRIVRSSQGGAKQNVGVDSTMNVNQALQHFLGSTVANALQHQHSSGGQLIATNKNKEQWTIAVPLKKQADRINQSEIEFSFQTGSYAQQTPETNSNSRKMAQGPSQVVAYSAPRPSQPNYHQQSAYNVPLPPQLPANAFIPSHYEQIKSPGNGQNVFTANGIELQPTIQSQTYSLMEQQQFPQPEQRVWNAMTQCWEFFPPSPHHLQQSPDRLKIQSRSMPPNMTQYVVQNCDENGYTAAQINSPEKVVLHQQQMPPPQNPKQIMHVAYANSFKSQQAASQDFYKKGGGQMVTSELDPVFKKILLNSSGLRQQIPPPMTQIAGQAILPTQTNKVFVRQPNAIPGVTLIPGNPTNGGYSLKGRIYKFQILPGNNSNLIRRVFNETRCQSWVELANQTQSHFHFRWSPTARPINFERLSHNFIQMVNHVEGHGEISNKHELFRNVKGYSEDRHENPFFIIPLTFCVKVQQEKLQSSLRQQLKPFKQVFKLLDEFGTLFNDTSEPSITPTPSKPSETSKVDTTGDESSPVGKREKMSAEYISETRKKIREGRCTVLVSKKGMDGGYTSSYYPSTGASPSKMSAKRFSNKSSLIMPMSHFGGHNIWILKPTGQNRGKGIHVVSSMKKLKKLIKDYVYGREYSIPAGGPQSSTVTSTAASMTQKAWQMQSSANSNGRGVSSPPQKNFLTGMKQQALPALQKNPVAQAYLMDQNLFDHNTMLHQLATSKPLMRRNNSFYGHRSKNNQQKSSLKQSKEKSDKADKADKAGKSIKSSNKVDSEKETDKAEVVSSQSKGEEPSNKTQADQTDRAIDSQNEEDEDAEEADEVDLERDSSCQTLSEATQQVDLIDPKTHSNSRQGLSNNVLQQASQQPPTPKTTAFPNRIHQNMAHVPMHSVLHQKANSSTMAAGGPANRVSSLAARQVTTQEKLMSNVQKASMAQQQKTFIIQKYLEHPALIYQRKFDIRVWVLLSHELDGYFFREGYLRTSSSPYSANKDNLEDDYMHLTNNAVQKKCPTYGAFEDGNMLSFEDFRRVLGENKSGVDFDADLLPQMKNQASMVLAAARKRFNPQKRKHCFELFGLDFILDHDYNVFLIEANTNPCLEESSGLLRVLLPRMIDDMLKLTVDKIFPMSHQDVIFGGRTQYTKSNVNMAAGGGLVVGEDPLLNQNKISHSPLKREEGGGRASRTDKNQPSIYPVRGYKDTQNMWQKIGAFKKEQGGSALAQQSIEYVWQARTKSERIIHLVNSCEMRVGKAEIIDKSAKRDLLVTSPSQTQ